MVAEFHVRVNIKEKYKKRKAEKEKFKKTKYFLIRIYQA